MVLSGKGLISCDPERIPATFSRPKSRVFWDFLEHVMDHLFVVVACLSLFSAVSAVLQVRRIGWAVWLWFLCGWLTGELAIWCIGLQAAFVALWVVLIGTDSPGFAWGCQPFWLPGRFWRGRSGMDSMPAWLSVDALRVALGPHFLTQIPEARRARLEHQILSREWLWPFRFRRPACAMCGI